MLKSIDLFGDVAPIAPRTEGIKYAGSKAKLIPAILKLARTVDASSLFDGFSGSTRVSQAFALSGYNVVSNDKAIWSKTLASCYLTSKSSNDHYQKLIDHLNNVKPFHGWFSENYGGFVDDLGFSVGQDGLKKPFQIHNANKLDAIRNEIDLLALNLDEKNVVLSSLILALEKVDSTLGHHVSYLKNWSPRSYKNLFLKLPRIIRSDFEHEVFCEDTINLTKEIKCDIAYFDPPYGSNNEKMPPSRVRYNSYYHLWKTIVLNDRPKLFGAAKRRSDSSDRNGVSLFEEYKKNQEGHYIALQALSELINNTRSENIILSYSSGGRATAAELNDILIANGESIEFLKISHRKNVMAHMRWTDDWINDDSSENFEYLFLLRR